MKWILRTWVFGTALIIGLFGATLVDLLTFEPRPVTIEEFERQREMPETLVNGSGVQVAYIDWEAGTPSSDSYLKFMVHNDSWEPLTYWGHGPNDMLAELKSNGRELELLGRCGTGMGPQLILPGASVVVNVRSFEFSSRPEANDLITAGFSLRRPFEERYKIYLSEPIILPEEFRTAIETR